MPNFHYFHFYKDENDGVGFGKNCSSRFQTTFAPSVYIVAWALPTIMLGKRGRLKF